MDEVWIRADGSAEIGTGHLFRCLALAQGLRLRDYSVKFVSRALPAPLSQLVKDSGFSILPLQTASEWDEIGSHASEKLKGIVVDHYGLDETWEREARKVLPRGWILAIDDLMDRPHVTDLLLNQNFVSDRSRFRFPPEGASVLWGPAYALLREDFLLARSLRIRKQGSLPKVKIFFGGGDIPDLTGRTLEALKGFRSRAQISVIAGGANPRRELLKRLCREEEFEFVSNSSHFVHQMNEADIFIGAGGSTIWERCCLGVPSLVISIAENQRQICQDMAAGGYLSYLGHETEVTATRIRESILEAFENPQRMIDMGQRSMDLVDGLGVTRVCNALQVLEGSKDSLVHFRPATWEDRSRLLDWRNDPVTRQNSIQTETTDPTSHESWLRKSLEHPGRKLFVAEMQGEPIGTVRFDQHPQNWELSWTLAPACRGRGLGKKMVKEATRLLSQPLIAQVKRTAPASARIAEYAGFTSTEQTTDMLFFTLDRPLQGQTRE